jgi:Amt family ammonium transporter
MIVEWSFAKKAKFVGLLTGAVAGLATITPCAGFVTPQASVLIGIAAGVVCYFAVALKNKLGWDDALDVWGVHGVGGLIGTIMLGMFAAPAVGGVAGLFYGNGSFLFKQVVAVVFSSIWAFLFTWIMLKLIALVTPVRVTAEDEESGIDFIEHGEVAYETDSL